MAVTIKPVVTREVLLRVSATGVTTSGSSWRRLQRDDIVTSGFRVDARTPDGRRTVRSQWYASSNALAILLADHANSHEDALEVRKATLKLETQWTEADPGDSNALKRLSQAVEELWARFKPATIRELRGTVVSARNGIARIEDASDESRVIDLLLPSGAAIQAGDALVVLQIASGAARWTTCVLPGSSDVEDSGSTVNLSQEYLDRVAPTGDALAQLEELLADDVEHTPITVTLA